jgi:hypothetical protein
MDKKAREILVKLSKEICINTCKGIYNDDKCEKCNIRSLFRELCDLID